MLRKIDHRDMGKGQQGFVESIFHFSFASYHNPDNIRFGVLRVVNDDIIDPNTGFDMHPHNDMEVITYVVEGELTHGDNLGNENTVERGQVQYFSAGTGIMHSENNKSDKPLRILQLWILPDKKGHKPEYGDARFPWDKRKNKWLHMVSRKNADTEVTINQDANVFVTEIDEENEISFNVEEGRQAYLIQIEGSSAVNGQLLDERDALEVVEEELSIVPHTKSHLMIIEMKKE